MKNILGWEVEEIGKMHCKACDVRADIEAGRLPPNFQVMSAVGPDDPLCRLDLALSDRANRPPFVLSYQPPSEADRQKALGQVLAKGAAAMGPS